MKYLKSLTERKSYNYIDKFRTELGITESLNKIDNTLYKFRPEILKLSELELSPIKHLIKEPIREGLHDVIFNLGFDDINGVNGYIYW